MHMVILESCDISINKTAPTDTSEVDGGIKFNANKYSRTGGNAIIRLGA